jgi:very-short-patch-repair endonuclease
MTNAWPASDVDLTLSRLRRSSLSRREREGGAQRRKGEAVKTYEQARSGAVLRGRQLRRDSTDAEKMLWKGLRETLPDYKWRRQMPVGPYFADFACFATKLIIEVDGGQHATGTEYDDRRTRFLQAQGYRVLRFWNNDVLGNCGGVMRQIAEAMPPSPSRGSAAHPSPLGRGREARSAGRVRP